MRRFILILILLCLSVPAKAALSVDVSSAVIGVTTGFDGAFITVFGTQDQQGTLVLVLEGPAKKITMRKKISVFGFWTYTDSQRFKNIPAFYDMAASAPLDTAASPEVLAQNRIGLASILPQGQEFADALIRIQQKNALYMQDVRSITYTNPMLFKVVFPLPATVASGHYKISAYLFQNGTMLEQAKTQFEVEPEGLSAKLRYFATEHSLLYGLVAVFMAMFTGWLATVLLKNGIDYMTKPAQKRRQGDGGTYLIIADDTPEFTTALHYAARMARTHRGHVAMARIIEPSVFTGWGKIEKTAKAEARMIAEKEMQGFAARVSDETGIIPSFIIREGDKQQEIVSIANGNPSLCAIVLASSADKSNPDPLISYLTAKGLSQISVPVIIIPKNAA